MSCIAPNSCWSPTLQYPKMWLYLDTQSLQRSSREREVTGVGPHPRGWVASQGEENRTHISIEGPPSEDAGRRQPSTTGGEKPRTDPSFETLRSNEPEDSSALDLWPQNRETVHFCYLSHAICTPRASESRRQ